MNAADSSCRTCTKVTRSCRVRSASMIPLMPSPGRPKTTRTPQSIRRSINTSAVVVAMRVLTALEMQGQVRGTALEYRLNTGGAMDTTTALVQMADQPALDVVAEPLADAIRSAYSTAGSAGQSIKNAMHGVWLGH